MGAVGIPGRNSADESMGHGPASKETLISSQFKAEEVENAVVAASTQAVSRRVLRPNSTRLRASGSSPQPPLAAVTAETRAAARGSRASAAGREGQSLAGVDLPLLPDEDERA